MSYEIENNALIFNSKDDVNFLIKVIKDAKTTAHPASAYTVELNLLIKLLKQIK